MSATATLPAETIELSAIKPSEPAPALLAQGRQLGSDRQHGSSHDTDGQADEDGSPLHPSVSRTVEGWNYPKGNTFRVAAVFWSLFVSGANDAAYGALIPYLETYYGLSYLVVSLIFLSPFAGFVISAAVNNWLHLNVGQRWIGFICGACHVVTYLILSQHPPYPVLVFAYAIAGLGNGIGLAAWNSFIGNLARSNELLGFMHASYGAGATISPLIATTMITQGHLGWYTFYYILVSQ